MSSVNFSRTSQINRLELASNKRAVNKCPQNVANHDLLAILTGQMPLRNDFDA